MDPNHSQVVSFVAIMLQSSAPDALSRAMCFAWDVATVEKSSRILSFSLKSDRSPEMLYISLENVGRQDSHTTTMSTV